LAQGYIILSQTECAHELEKSRLIIEQQNKEIIELLKHPT